MKCFLNDENKLLFKDKCWVFNLKSLCTRLIQYIYNLIMTKHSKRNITDKLMFK